MAGWGDIPIGSKNNGLNHTRPENHVPCIARVIQNHVESYGTQANSCDNLNKGYCKLGQVKGDCSGTERANSYAPPITRALYNMSYECVSVLAHETLNPRRHMGL